MYGGIGVSAPSLHRESTDSLTTDSLIVSIATQIIMTLAASQYLPFIFQLWCQFLMYLPTVFMGYMHGHSPIVHVPVYVCENSACLPN